MRPGISLGVVMLAVSSVLAENAAGPLQGGVSIPLASQSPKEAHMTEVEKLKEEAEALRRRIGNLEFDLEAARTALTNAALEGAGFYVFSDDGEYNRFDGQHEAYLFQRTLQDEGTGSVLMRMLSRLDGVDADVEGGTYTPPPRPSHDPQDVRNAA